MGRPSIAPALNVPAKRRGWYAILPQIGAPLGLIVASALFAFFISSLSANDFLEWGWRYPFFVAFAINVVALFARLRIVQVVRHVARCRNRAADALLSMVTAPFARCSRAA